MKLTVLCNNWLLGPFPRFEKRCGKNWRGETLIKELDLSDREKALFDYFNERINKLEEERIVFETKTKRKVK